MKIKESVAVAAPVGGFLLGFLDFVWIKYVPSTVGGLGNSLAVWAVAAFLFTFFTRSWGWVRGIVAAVILLVVAVPSYYLAAALIQQDNYSNMYNNVAILWAGFGVIAGVVFGAAGVAARTPGWWLTPALAMPGAVMFAEAVLVLVRSQAGGVLWTVLLNVALGVLLTIWVGGTWRRRSIALLLAVPLAVVGFGLLTVARFG